MARTVSIGTQNFEKIIINEEELSDKKINSTRTIL